MMFYCDDKGRIIFHITKLAHNHIQIIERVNLMEIVKKFLSNCNLNIKSRNQTITFNTDFSNCIFCVLRKDQQNKNFKLLSTSLLSFSLHCGC
jgi:hypothetical protein